jgi:hypothetical protein
MIEISHDEFVKYVEAMEDDISTFIDCHRGEIEELFETGSVTINYTQPDKSYQEFVIELKISKVGKVG